MEFFFFFFSRVFTVNRARLGRPPQWSPIAKIEHLYRIADTRLLFGGRIRRARSARQRTPRRDDGAIFSRNFSNLTTHLIKNVNATVSVGRPQCLFERVPRKLFLRNPHQNALQI
jgi:hypothetical protein